MLSVLVVAAVLLVLASESATARIAPPPGGGGGSGGGSGSGTPITTIVTNVYGWGAQPLNDVSEVNTSHNIPTVSGVPLGTWDAGVGSANDPGSGRAAIASETAGVAEAEADQQMGIAYTSQAPAGVESSLRVTAIVDSHDGVIGFTGAGGQCAPSEVNWSSPTLAYPDPLSSCLSTYQFNIPVGDDSLGGALDDVDEDEASYAAEAYGDLTDSQQDLLQRAQDGVAASEQVLTVAQTLSSDYEGIWGHGKRSEFTWNGSIAGGSTLYFTVDPEVVTSDVGLGTEVNAMSSNVEFVVTQTYTQNQYSYDFPTAEAGFPLGNDQLMQCSQYPCTGIPGDPELTSGALPAGVTATEQNGYAALSGTPAAGSQGVYEFDLTINGAIYDCALQVAPPLTLIQDNDTSTFYYEQQKGFIDNVPPFEVTGGYYASPVSLADNPSWLYLTYNEADTEAFLAVYGNPPPGTYTFEVRDVDVYTTVTSAPLQLVVLRGLTLTSGTKLGALVNHSFSDGLSGLASGGLAPYSWAIDGCQACGSLPPGLSLDAADGVISGVPTLTGTYSFIVAVTDSADVTVTAQMTLLVTKTISPPAN